MARYVDADKLKVVLDRETLIETQNELIKYYDRTLANHLINVLSFEVEGELKEAEKVNEETEYLWK